MPTQRDYAQTEILPPVNNKRTQSSFTYFGTFSTFMFCLCDTNKSKMWFFELPWVYETIVLWSYYKCINILRDRYLLPKISPSVNLTIVRVYQFKQVYIQNLLRESRSGPNNQALKPIVFLTVSLKTSMTLWWHRLTKAN